jgi:glycosyltransferase involved in cell wall biosynthesis
VRVSGRLAKVEPGKGNALVADPLTISVVTPSYNQAPFLEQTIRSVLDQEGVEVEHIVMDGGSRDGSADIIKRYEDRLAFWRSEPDDGQADAVFQGFERAKGNILAYLNSDDYYMPGALAHVARLFARRPEAELLIGGCSTVDARGDEVYRDYGFPYTFEGLLHWGCRFSQPASFWRRSAFFDVGGFDRSLRFCFDYDMYLRLTRRRPAMATSRILAAFRVHPQSKTSTIQEVKQEEDRLVWQRHGRFETPEDESRRLARKTARAHFRRKALFLALDALGEPRMAWREIRNRLRARRSG